MWLLDRIRRPRLNSEIAEEIEAHLSERTDDLVEAGMDPREARQKARREFGNVTRYLETSREVWTPQWLEQLGQDIRYAGRTFRRSPIFTLTVVLSLALGIGANTAIFSLMDAVMFRELPVRNPEALWVPHFTHPTSPQGFLFRYSAMGDEFFFPFRWYRELQNRSTTAEIAAYSSVRLSVSLKGEMQPTVEGLRVSGNYFSLLGVEPILGQVFTMDDDRVPNGHPVAMISYGYWRRYFHSDPLVVGQTLLVSGTPFRIVGVTPPEFFGVEVGTSPEVFVPVMMQPAVTPVVSTGVEGGGTARPWLQLIARLKPGVSPEAAAAELRSLYPQSRNSGNATRELTLSPAVSGVSGLRFQFSRTLMVLMGVVALVLLIACANTSTLLLARATARRREFAIRLALGAERGRLIRQLLVESLCLAAVGGVLGIVIAQAVIRALLEYMSAGRTPIVLDLSPDLRVLVFTVAVSVVTGVLFGLIPAFRATHMDLTSAMKGPSALKLGRLTLRPGKVLAVVQVSLSLLLLVGAVILARGLQSLDPQDSGFPRENVLMVRVEPRDSNQRNLRGVSDRLHGLYLDLIDRVQRIPGVRSVSLSNVSPTKPDSGADAEPLQLADGETVPVAVQMVYPNYFATLGESLLHGRDFEAGDLGRGAEPVCIVNKAYAAAAFGGESAIGKSCFNVDEAPRIVGVVGNCQYTNLKQSSTPVIYQPFLQTDTVRGQMILHVRTEGDAASIVPRVREEVWRTDKDVPQFEVRTLAEELEAVLIRERLIATLVGCFSALALLLACIGLYGLFSFAVAQRTGELGLRKALGARSADIVWMILREAAGLVALGLLVWVPMALLAGWLLREWLADLLYGFEPLDASTVGIATVLLLTTALLAAYLPARRAARIDPVPALKTE
jgi:predicted permease